MQLNYTAILLHSGKICEYLSMGLIIGEIIRKKAEGKGLTQKDLGKLINRHEKTVANIYKRVTIDTRLLCQIAVALEYDFFQHYYEEEPLKTLLKSEMKKLQEHSQSLEMQVEQLKQELKSKQKQIDMQEDYISLLKKNE